MVMVSVRETNMDFSLEVKRRNFGFEETWI
jgi:hypothetical protein